MDGFLALVVFVVIVMAVKKNANKGNTARPNVPRNNAQDELDRLLRQPMTSSRGSSTIPTNLRDSMRTTNTSDVRARQNGAASQMISSGQYPQRTVGTGTQTAAKGTVSARTETATEPEATKTTDYLEEKARLDQIEHMKEKKEEQVRMAKIYGRQPVGGRYLLGDPIPNGQRIVCCSYCGAENLVNYNYSGGCDCYFCRTEL
ncbi:MAG: hypothetical protein K6G07_00040 [Lachnospiraceae bacterium]|nr:hypothetical protein [Lachnospiraceae bacterium]